MLSKVIIYIKKFMRLIKGKVDQSPMKNMYLNVVPSEEIQRIRNLSLRPVHPIVHLALSEGDRQVATNTEMAAKSVYRQNRRWLESLVPRLVATDDPTHSSSALGEIRAYGALLETWMTVTPAPTVEGKKISPEFEIDNGDGAVIVEVHTRQLDKAQAKSIKRSHDELKKKHAEAVLKPQTENAGRNIVTISESEIFPTGEPNPDKAGDSVDTNTISRIASIKGDENQIDPAKPFILWLDLQDETVWGFAIPEDHFSPFYSELREGAVAPGCLWQALYGRKGDPLLISKGYDYSSMPLAHEGRFYQTIRSHGGPSRVSAVVFSLPRATVLMENPNAPRPLPARARAALLKLPFFRADLSIIEWEPGTVAAIISAQRQATLAAEKALKAFDAAG